MNRVLSIAATHELLSSQQDDSIQIEHLLKRVIENVQRCFSGHREIVLTYSLEPELCLDSSRATSLALIVNELLQNSYEHAFKDKKNPEKPQIRLQVGLKNDIITLKVLDNGSGYNQEHSYSWWSALSKENCLEPCLSTQTMRERQRPFVLKNKYYQTNNDVSRKKQ